MSTNKTAKTDLTTLKTSVIEEYNNLHRSARVVQNALTRCVKILKGDKIRQQRLKVELETTRLNLASYRKKCSQMCRRLEERIRLESSEYSDEANHKFTGKHPRMQKMRAVDEVDRCFRRISNIDNGNRLVCSEKIRDEVLDAYLQRYGKSEFVKVSAASKFDKELVDHARNLLQILDPHKSTEEVRQDMHVICSAFVPVVGKGPDCSLDRHRVNKAAKRLGVSSSRRTIFRSAAERTKQLFATVNKTGSDFEQGDMVFCRGGHKGILETLNFGCVEVRLPGGTLLKWSSKRAARLRHPPPKLRPPRRKTRFVGCFQVDTCRLC